jgi:hypothetical protein
MKPEILQPLNVGLSKIRNLIIFVALLCFFNFCACSSSSDEQPVRLSGEENVLATVNGSDISAYDLQQAVDASLGAAAQGMLDAQGRQSVLESLVAARAIGQAQEKELSAADRAALAKQVAAYREQLLVKMYLARHVKKEPVSRKMAQDYYDRHRDQYGEKTIKQYELITSGSALSDTARDRLLAALRNADKQKDWSAWSRKLEQNGLPVAYKRGSCDPAILTADLRSQLAGLNPGQPANLAFADGVISLARVTAQTKVPARPFEEVSAGIRKTLLPVQLKKAVKKAAGQVLKEAEVVYMQSNMEKVDSVESK